MDNLQGMKDRVYIFLILVFVCGPVFLTIVQNPVLRGKILTFIHLWGVCPHQTLNTSDI